MNASPKLNISETVCGRSCSINVANVLNINDTLNSEYTNIIWWKKLKMRCHHLKLQVIHPISTNLILLDNSCSYFVTLKLKKSHRCVLKAPVFDSPASPTTWHICRGLIWGVEGGHFKTSTLIYRTAGGEPMAETLEKYQHIFTHDLHLSHSCCSEGHLAEPSSLRCLLLWAQILTLVHLSTKHLQYKEIWHKFQAAKNLKTSTKVFHPKSKSHLTNVVMFLVPKV